MLLARGAVAVGYFGDFARSKLPKGAEAGDELVGSMSCVKKQGDGETRNTREGSQRHERLSCRVCFCLTHHQLTCELFVVSYFICQRMQ